MPHKFLLQKARQNEERLNLFHFIKTSLGLVITLKKRFGHILCIFSQSTENIPNDLKIL